MTFALTPYAIPLLTSGCVAIAVAALALRRRGRPGAIALALMMTAVAVWALAYALDVVGGNLATKLFGYRLEYVGIPLAPVAYYAFACRYTGRSRWAGRRALGVLLIEPCLIIVLIWLGATRSFVLPDIQLDASGPFLALRSGWGPGFWVHAAYSYVLLLLASRMVGASFLRSRHLYRAQAAAILVSVAVPWVANLLYLTGHSPLPPLDLTAPALTVSGIGLGWGLLRFRFLELAPVVRGTVFQGIADAVVVVDAQGCIRDLNTRAEEMLGAPAAAVIGRSFAALAGLVIGAVDRAPNGSVLTFGDGEGRRYFELTTSPVADRETRAPCTLLVLRDVTERTLTQRRIAESEQRYRSLFEQNPDAAYALDLHGNVTSANSASERTCGYAREEVLGHPFLLLVAPEHRRRAWRCFRRAARGEPQTFEAAIVNREGRRIALQVTNLPIVVEGEITGVYGIAKDITEQQRAMEEIRALEAQNRRLIEDANDMILVYDGSGRLTLVNRRFCEVMGYTREQATALHVLDLVHHDDRMRMAQAMREHAAGAAPRPREFCAVTRDGRTLHIDSRCSDVELKDGTRGVQLIARDVSERKRAEELLQHQALHDALTGLPNRVLFGDRLQQGLLEAARERRPLSLLLLDLDRFKEVNDTLGHLAGDLLLRQAAERLRGALRAADTVARLGGDEFAVLLKGADESRAVGVATALLTAIEAPFAIEGQQVDVGASIGVVFARRGDEPGALLRYADIAMYVAKRSHSGHAVYSPEQDDHSPERLALVSELRRAIELDQLVLHYQPKLDLASGRLCRVEALVRWQRPGYGLVPPDEFIPLAERTGLIRPLSRWVLNTALRQCRAWEDAGLSLAVAVNLAAQNLHEAGLPDLITELLDTWGVSPRSLIIEVTETGVLSDQERAAAVLTRLRAMGVRIAIDDFGTGNAALGYLKRLPIDQLKIDRSFVKDLASSASDDAIVGSTIDLAHRLGLDVVAEGVEDQAALDRLAALGCDTAQGYYLCRPLPVEQLMSWIETAPWAAERRLPHAPDAAA